MFRRRSRIGPAATSCPLCDNKGILIFVLAGKGLVASFFVTKYVYIRLIAYDISIETHSCWFLLGLADFVILIHWTVKKINCIYIFVHSMFKLIFIFAYISIMLFHDSSMMIYSYVIVLDYMVAMILSGFHPQNVYSEYCLGLHMNVLGNGNIFRRYWPFVRWTHRSTVNSPHKGQWRGALMFSLVSAWINDWENNHEAGDLRRHGAHYDVIVMELRQCIS